MFADLLMWHISLKGESHDDLLAHVKHRISGFTFLSQPFYCLTEWTFARINYHYMGLPFLCMLGSFRITGRLLYIFKKRPTRSAFIFSIRQFLVRPFVSTVLKPCRRINFHILSMRNLWIMWSFFIRKNRKLWNSLKTHMLSLVSYVSKALKEIVVAI